MSANEDQASPALPAPPVAINNVIATAVSNLEKSLPLTPHKNQQELPGAPMTPTANLKMLVAAATIINRDREDPQPKNVKHLLGVESEGVDSEGGGVCEEDLSGRKTKSLAILCKKFLSIAESEVGEGSEFSLEHMAQSLGTNRRRIYDIINVLESLEMIVKQSKNWYLWLGQKGLLSTLAKLKAMAHDDVDFRQLYDAESSKENTLMDLHCVSVSDVGVESEDGGTGSRWDKSLGVLCQKFVMIFLVTPNNEVTLDCAGNILMPDTATESTATPSANPKTKVRRLYDIANVLTTLGLIRKKTFLAPNHRKMPGYCWCGPSQEEINAIPVSRKNEFLLAPLYPSKKQSTPALAGTSLSRRPSFGKSRPFLHQYEVKGQPGAPTLPNSAPTSPVKIKGVGFKRSLSFGGGSNPKKFMGEGVRNFESEPLPVTKVNPKYWMYLSEIRAFEAEMLKHAEKFPHVVPLFRDFIQKCVSSLDGGVSIGRTILPKPATPTLNKTMYPQKLPLGKLPIPPLSMDPAHRTLNSPSPLIKTTVSSDQQMNLSKATTELPRLTRPSQSPPELLAMQAFTKPSQTPPELLAMQGQSVPVGYRTGTLPVSVVLPQNVLVGDLLNQVSSVSESPSSRTITTRGQTKPSPQPVNLECFEVLSTEGYSKQQQVSLRANVSSQPTSVRSHVSLTPTTLNKLVNQKPIPATAEGVPIQPKPVACENKTPSSSHSTSALLASHIVSLFSHLSPSLLPTPTSQLKNLTKSVPTPPSLSSSVAHQASTSTKTSLPLKNHVGSQTKAGRKPLSELNSVNAQASIHSTETMVSTPLGSLQENRQTRKLKEMQSKGFNADKESPPKRVCIEPVGYLKD